MPFKTVTYICNRYREPEHKVDHSLPCSVMVKNSLTFISIPSYVFMMWCLIKQLDYFARPYLVLSVTYDLLRQIHLTPASCGNFSDIGACRVSGTLHCRCSKIMTLAKFNAGLCNSVRGCNQNLPDWQPWGENCKWYSSLLLGAILSLFCE
jgi:hypothetical protein